MDQRHHFAPWLVWTGLGLTAALLVLTFVTATLARRTADALPVYGQVNDFALTNQNDRRVSLADLRGHPWVADIIFTRCAGPCLRMTRQMKSLQASLPRNSSVRLLSLTTDPEYDTPQVFRTYGERFGVDANRWWLLTGTKKQIADLAIGSLKLSAIEKTPEQRQSAADLFIHSTILVLVDKQGRLRGIYQTGGEGVDPRQERARILKDLRALEREG